MTHQQSKYVDKQVAIVSLIAAIIGGIFSFLPTFIILTYAADYLNSILGIWMIPLIFILIINLAFCFAFVQSLMKV